MALVVKELAWHEVDAAVRQEWLDLMARCGANATLRPDWMEVSARAWGRLGDLRVAVVREGEGGSLRAVIPLLRGRRKVLRIPVRTLELGSNLVAYHPEIIAVDRHEEYLARVLDEVGGGWTAFVAENLVEGGATEQAVGVMARREGSFVATYKGDLSPFLPLPREWDSLVASKPKKFRYRIRKAQSDLAERPELVMRWYEGGSDSRELLDHVLAVERHSWKRDAGMDIERREQERLYHELVLHLLSEENMLFSNVLELHGEPVAFSLCYAWNGVVGQMKTSFDDRFAEMSPGFMVMVESIHRAVTLGFREYDFLGDIMQHKMRWADEARLHTSRFVFSRRPLGLALGMAKRAALWVQGKRREQKGAVAGEGTAEAPLSPSVEVAP